MLPGVMPAGVPAYGVAYAVPQLPSLPVVKLRGLPFRCDDADVYEFFTGLEVVDILFVRKEKRFTGDAYVLFSSTLHSEAALQRNKMYMGRRYVEVFRAKKAEWYNAIANEVAEEGGVYPDDGLSAQARASAAGGSTPAYFDAGGSRDADQGPRAESASYSPGQGAPARSGDSRHTGILRLRGLPFSCTTHDVLEFFSGFPLSEEVVHIITNASGRSTGECFVEFASPEDSKRAMSKDRGIIGTRYIEIWPSSREEANAVATRASKA